MSTSVTTHYPKASFNLEQPSNFIKTSEQRIKNNSDLISRTRYPSRRNYSTSICRATSQCPRNPSKPRKRIGCRSTAVTIGAIASRKSVFPKRARSTGHLMGNRHWVTVRPVIQHRTNASVSFLSLFLSLFLLLNDYFC